MLRLCALLLLASSVFAQTSTPDLKLQENNITDDSHVLPGFFLMGEDRGVLLTCKSNGWDGPLTGCKILEGASIDAVMNAVLHASKSQAEYCEERERAVLRELAAIDKALKRTTGETVTAPAVKK